MHFLLRIRVSPIRFVLSSPVACNSFWCTLVFFVVVVVVAFLLELSGWDGTDYFPYG